MTDQGTTQVDIVALVESAGVAVKEHVETKAEQDARQARHAKRSESMKLLRAAKEEVKSQPGWRHDDTLMAQVTDIEKGMSQLESEGEEDGQNLAGINAFADLSTRAWNAAKDAGTHFGTVIQLLHAAEQNKNARLLDPNDEADRAISEDESKERAIVSIRERGDTQLYFFEGALSKRSVQNLLKAIKKAKWRAGQTSRTEREDRKAIKEHSTDAAAAARFVDGEYAIEIELKKSHGRGRPTTGILVITVVNGNLTLDNVLNGRGGNLRGYMTDKETRESLIGGSWGRGKLPGRLHWELRRAAGEDTDSHQRGRQSSTDVRAYQAQSAAEDEADNTPTAMEAAFAAIPEPKTVVDFESTEEVAFAATPDLEALAKTLQSEEVETAEANRAETLAEEFGATSKAAQLAIDHNDDPAEFLGNIAGTGKDATITVADVKRAGKARS